MTKRTNCPWNFIMSDYHFSVALSPLDLSRYLHSRSSGAGGANSLNVTLPVCTSVRAPGFFNSIKLRGSRKVIHSVHDWYDFCLVLHEGLKLRRLRWFFLIPVNAVLFQVPHSQQSTFPVIYFLGHKTLHTQGDSLHCYKIFVLRSDLFQPLNRNVHLSKSRSSPGNRWNFPEAPVNKKHLWNFIFSPCRIEYGFRNAVGQARPPHLSLILFDVFLLYGFSHYTSSSFRRFVVNGHDIVLFLCMILLQMDRFPLQKGPATSNRWGLADSEGGFWTCTMVSPAQCVFVPNHAASFVFLQQLEFLQIWLSFDSKRSSCFVIS